MMNRPSPRTLVTAALVAGAVLVLGGCLAGKRPLYEHGSEGSLLMEKRIPRFPEVNHATRFQSLAYRENMRRNVTASSLDQKEVLEEFGQPDYVRIQFMSTRGDRVDEWAYLEHNKCLQFVRHALVYEGVLSDKDRVVIQWGYPNNVLVQHDMLGARRETYIYTDLFDSDTKYFSFADDKMIMGKTTY